MKSKYVTTPTIKCVAITEGNGVKAYHFVSVTGVDYRIDGVNEFSVGEFYVITCEEVRMNKQVRKPWMIKEIKGGTE